MVLKVAGVRTTWLVLGSLTGVVMLGAAALLLPRPRPEAVALETAVPELVQRGSHLPSALEAAETFVEAGVGVAYPGGAVAAGVGARIERVTAFGRIGWRTASPPVIADTTLYDVASLTKVMATTMAVLLLVQDGTIELDDAVQRHLPELEGRWKESVTWRHLLTHTSGLPAGTVVRGSTPRERLRRLLRTRLGAPPGRLVEYSDLGYVAAWAAAERAAGEPLPALLTRRVWRPLGMEATGFSPGRDCAACAPTLRLKTGEPFRGLPSDPLARALGGTAGNAGLFSTIGDVARFTAMVAAGGELDGVRILDPDLAREMLVQQPGAGRRTLGWTAFCPDEEPDPAQACERPIAVGHNGWTGTSIWLDPVDGYWVALLTNRSYERADRPFPLDDLRRELFLRMTGVETGTQASGWLVRTPPDTAGAPVAPAPARGSAAR